MPIVSSADGTPIAYTVTGAGPTVVLVDGAMCYRAAGPMTGLAQRLSADATVVTYDRRGRGESGDTPPYAVERELEDLTAVIDAVGGDVAAFGLSSGGALVLRAAAAGVPWRSVALYEVPFTGGDEAYTRDLTALLAAGRRGDAVARFMTMVGLPSAAIDGMRGSPAWPVFEAIAPTLAYDNAVLGDGRAPDDLAARVSAPVLLLDGGASPPGLRAAMAGLAAVLPAARRLTLAGQTHDIDPDVLAPVLTSFLRDTPL